MQFGANMFADETIVMHVVYHEKYVQDFEDGEHSASVFSLSF